MNNFTLTWVCIICLISDATLFLLLLFIWMEQRWQMNLYIHICIYFPLSSPHQPLFQREKWFVCSCSPAYFPLAATRGHSYVEVRLRGQLFVFIHQYLLSFQSFQFIRRNQTYDSRYVSTLVITEAVHEESEDFRCEMDWGCQADVHCVYPHLTPLPSLFPLP